MFSQGDGRSIFGGHKVDPPMPADGGPNSGNTGMGSGGGGGGGNQVGQLREAYEVNQQMAANARAMPWGFGNRTGVIGGHDHQRIEDWQDETGWDGDLRWPPPGLNHKELVRHDRLEAMRQQQEEIAWRSGEAELAMIRRDKDEADLWSRRARRGLLPPT